MSLSRSPIWTHRPGSPSSSVDCRTFSNHLTLSFLSMATRVGLIFFFSAAAPLNFSRVQNLAAVRPSGSPSLVTAKLECIRMPHTACDRRRPALSRPLLTLYVKPIARGSENATSLRRPILSGIHSRRLDSKWTIDSIRINRPNVIVRGQICG